MIQAEPFTLSTYGPELPTLPVTISVGVATIDAMTPTELRSVEAVLNAADQAVYAAKKSGRNRVCLGNLGGKPTNVDGSEIVVFAEKPTEKATKPAAEAAVATPAKPAERMPDGKLHVVIVDSDPLALKLLAVLFGKRPDLTVSGAKNSDEAFNHLKAAMGRPVLALVESRLGRINGLDLCKQFSVNASKPMVIVMSSNLDDATRAAATVAGATMCVSKHDLATSFDVTVSGMLQRVSGARAVA